jgi:CRP/FNR family transcriptional regulator, anaerobic regulatory protein
MNWKELFPQFEPGLIEIIEKESVQKKFVPGEVIMRTGQYIKSTALVLEGKIKIYRESQDGGEFLMYFLGPGQACAVSMICALQSETSEITAIAEEETEVLLIPVQLMDDLMNKYKSWYQFVIQTYRSRFDELITVVDNIAFKNMDERLEFYLKRYVKNSGKNTIELSHQQIADDLNSSREVISRLLKKMEQQKRVRLNRNMIEMI